MPKDASSASSEASSVIFRLPRQLSGRCCAYGDAGSCPVFFASSPPLSSIESGWHSLRGLAAQDGASLTPAYLSSLVKSQGGSISFLLWPSMHSSELFSGKAILKHPLCYIHTLDHIPLQWRQWLALWLAEHKPWCLHLQKTSVFSLRGYQPQLMVARLERSIPRLTAAPIFFTARHPRGNTAGKKLDERGFAAFFAIFDVTRRIAVNVRNVAQTTTRSVKSTSGNSSKKNQLPQLLQGVTLVTGGVIAGLSYEVIGRPWDVARHAARLNLLTDREYRSPLVLVTQKIKQDGFLSLFRDPTAARPSTARSRIYSVLRTLARVGPWGVGFLVYQAYDAGLS
ncbi:hypothetical protein MVEN_02096900 [Mycena venus]|uniref:Mitochondrial carrier protein n=1 Tax=Mycena venus TaxID=2733690 RepID=A0A8H6XCA9_9AGAR|nr:hypothetical protein MVEN_02096900 [Mycena venus]